MRCSQEQLKISGGDRTRNHKYGEALEFEDRKPAEYGRDHASDLEKQFCGDPLNCEIRPTIYDIFKFGIYFPRYF